MYPQRGNVLAQGPAVKDVDKLCTAADTQHRNVNRLRLAEKLGVGSIPFQVIPGRHLGLLTIAARMHVGAARENQPVQ